MTDLNEPTLATEGVLRPTHLAVDLDRLAANFRAIAAHVAPARVLAVLKANAYGHGLVPVARLYERLGAAMLGVAFLEEGIRLRRAGVAADILVLGGILGSQIPLFLDHDLVITASSVDKLLAVEEAAARTGRTARVHLKIDTGMGRIGVRWTNAARLAEAALRAPHVRVEGVFSHFANADALDPGHARVQLARFHEALAAIEATGLRVPLRHIANSGAILRLPEAHLDMVRPGILLYGVYPSREVPRTVAVEPALTWRSRVVYFKVVLPGHAVGYGSTWAPDRPTRVVTVPVGYGDGYPRRLSGRAEVILRGKRRPVVGRVSMDQITVSIGWDSAWNGDEVVLLGRSGDLAITAEELADLAGTIPYEILTGINTRVPRVYTGELAALADA